MGYGISAILVTMSLLLLVTYTGREKWYLFGIICFYLLLNIAYCVKLKQITIIDVFIIAFGFVLRIFVGGVAVGIHLSHWIILMTFLLALFLLLPNVGMTWSSTKKLECRLEKTSTAITLSL